MTKSLGDLLQRNIDNARTLDLHAQRNRKAALDAEAQKRNAVILQFFESAKTKITEAITAGQTPDRICLQVGGRRYTPATIDTHPAFTEILEGYSTHTPPNENTMQPRSLCYELAPAWTDFKQWAGDNGLIAYWEYAWEGGGMDSWWLLRVKPQSSHQRSTRTTKNPQA